MDINVDIQGELFPNLATMIVQLLSTGVLVWFVWKFLWKPAHKYLDEKAALIQKPLDEALARETSAREMNEEAQRNLSESAKKAEEMIKTGQKEGQKARDELIREGQQKVDQMIDMAHKEIASEKAKMQSEIQEQIVDVAMAAAEKLMKKQMTAEANKTAVEEFIREVADGQ